MLTDTDNLLAVAVIGMAISAVGALTVAGIAVRAASRGSSRLFRIQQELADRRAEETYRPERFRTRNQQPVPQPPPPASRVPTEVLPEFMRGRAEPRSHRAGADHTRIDTRNVP